MGKEQIQNIRLEREESGLELVFDAYCDGCGASREVRGKFNSETSAFYRCVCGREYLRSYDIAISFTGKSRKVSLVKQAIDLAKHLS